MASIEDEDEDTPQSEVEALQKQLAAAQAQSATLQASLDEHMECQDPSMLTDTDYKRIAAMVLRLQTCTDPMDCWSCSLTYSPAESSQLAKQPDPPLLSDGKEPMYTSWSILICTKLWDNNDYFPSEDSKLTYIYRHMTGDAQAHLEPWHPKPILYGE